MDWTLICTTNDDHVLESCLLKSPDIRNASEVMLQRGYNSAAAALNTAIHKASTDLLICAHQDVYFPEGWIASLQRALDILLAIDPNWGVLGVWGITPSGAVGHVYSSGLRKTLGKAFDKPVEVESLDEVVLILRKSSRLLFDEALPGFHMYAPDICLQARQRSLRCYALSAFCIHNSNGYRRFPLQFWRAYLSMRQKWKSALPVTTSCITITHWCWPMLQCCIAQTADILLRRQPGTRVDDPTALYHHLVRRAA